MPSGSWWKMSKPKIDRKQKCFLTVRMKIGKDGVPRFAGYRLQGPTEPWNNTAVAGEMQGIIFATEADSFGEAHKRMLETARYLASIDGGVGKSWKRILPWIDDEYEAHMARFDLMQEADARIEREEKAEELTKERDEARSAFEKLDREVGEVVRDVRERSSETIARRFFDVLVNNRPTW